MEQIATLNTFSHEYIILINKEADRVLTTTQQAYMTLKQIEELNYKGKHQSITIR